MASQGAVLLLNSGCSAIFPETYYGLPSSGAVQASRKDQARPCPRPAKARPRDCAIHQVALTETVPRLAQMYGVSERSILRANHLRAGEPLTPGSKLIIPHPTQYKNIIPVYPNDRWRYIIVHHTAGQIGDALRVDRMHRQRGFIDGLGYDFLIDNGSLAKGNGEVEVAPRWVKQQVGAHCKADRMNFRGIGIALVGNFDHARPSSSQMLTLTKLVALLGDYYQIPMGHVLGHRQVPGAHTDCPGKRFPWDRFAANLRTVYAPGLC